MWTPCFLLDDGHHQVCEVNAALPKGVRPCLTGWALIKSGFLSLLSKTKQSLSGKQAYSSPGQQILKQQALRVSSGLKRRFPLISGQHCAQDKPKWECKWNSSNTNMAHSPWAERCTVWCRISYLSLVLMFDPAAMLLKWYGSQFGRLVSQYQNNLQRIPTVFWSSQKRMQWVCKVQELTLPAHALGGC